MANNKLDGWAKDCRKAMIERDNMKVSELAEAIGCNRVIVSSVINCSANRDDIRQRICDYLGVDSRL